MSSAMKVMQSLDTGRGQSKGVRAGAVLASGVLGYGASMGIGYVYHKHGDKWWGRNIAKITAAGGKIAAVGLSFFGGAAPSVLRGAVDVIGQSGVNALGLDHGLRLARKKTGKKAILVDAGADIAKLPGASEMTAMGALGEAQAGRGMSWDAVQELASGH